MIIGEIVDFVHNVVIVVVAAAAADGGCGRRGRCRIRVLILTCQEIQLACEIKND